MFPPLETKPAQDVFSCFSGAAGLASGCWGGGVGPGGSSVSTLNSWKLAPSVNGTTVKQTGPAQVNSGPQVGPVVKTVTKSAGTWQH